MITERNILERAASVLQHHADEVSEIILYNALHHKAPEFHEQFVNLKCSIEDVLDGITKQLHSMPVGDEIMDNYRLV